MGETQWTTTWGGSGLTGAYLRNKRFTPLSEPPAPWLTPVLCHSVTIHLSRDKVLTEDNQAESQVGSCCAAALHYSLRHYYGLQALWSPPSPPLLGYAFRPDTCCHFSRLASFWDCYFILGAPLISTISSLHHLGPDFPGLIAHVQKHNMWAAPYL